MSGTTGMTTKNKIGIFGGTFDPIHKAHVAIANEFLNRFELDMLYVIPNKISPLKNSQSAYPEHRKEMLEIAFSGNERVVISDIELKREGVSFTCDTVAGLKEAHPESELFLLIGDDWIGRFDRWRNYRFIIENARLVVASRSGSDITADLDRLEELTGIRPIELGNGNIIASSSDFRDNRNKELLPNGVYEYIKERGLYGI